jgi:MOSC domain-containing protein YiiM
MGGWRGRGGWLARVLGHGRVGAGLRADLEGWQAMTQTEQVLDYLRRHRSITPMEALRKIGAMRLGARIYDLRRAGHRISTQLVTVKPGTRVARYTLTGTE